jgi:protein phosphatase 1 regulatory subunit 7
LSGLSTLTHLEELYVSHNAITHISGLESNTKLRILDITSNQISHLENLSHLKQLEELWASNNQLESFEEVERELRDKGELTTVYFEGNPLQLKGPAVYRNKVRLALPQVQQIDASELFFHFGFLVAPANPVTVTGSVLLFAIGVVSNLAGSMLITVSLYQAYVRAS